MDERQIDFYPQINDLSGIKEFISRNGYDLNEKKFPMPYFYKTVLKYVICKYKTFKALNDSRDEILLYLIDEETKARCANNKWDFWEWSDYILYSVYNEINEKVVLKLIHTGSNYIVDFHIGPICIFTAVHMNYNISIIFTLIKYCSKVKLQESTLLIEAVSNYWHADIIKSLIDAGARYQLPVGPWDDQNLFFCVGCKCCDGSSCRSKQTVDLLVRNGVDLKILDCESNTIIHATDCYYLIYLAIKNGVSIEQKNKEGFSPLVTAIAGCKFNKVKIFLQLGADPNSVLSKYGCVTEDFCWFELVDRSLDLLFYYGADFEAETEENKSPLDLLSSSEFLIDLKKLISNYIFFMNQNNLVNYFSHLGDSELKEILSFLKECKFEQDKMKNTYFNDELTLYDFCRMKKHYKSKFVNNSAPILKLNGDKMTDLFPIYCNFIKIRIEDDVCKRWKRVLREILENLLISPINNLDFVSLSTDSNIMNYDCLYYLSKFLNSNDVYQLFLAST